MQFADNGSQNLQGGQKDFFFFGVDGRMAARARSRGLDKVKEAHLTYRSVS